MSIYFVKVVDNFINKNQCVDNKGQQELFSDHKSAEKNLLLFLKRISTHRELSLKREKTPQQQPTLINGLMSLTMKKAPKIANKTLNNIFSSLLTTPNNPSK